MADYLPRKESDLLPWFDHFSLKFAAYESTFGMAAEQMAQKVRQDYLWLNYCAQQVLLFNEEVRQRVEFRDLMRDGPLGATATPLPDVGSNFQPPSVPMPAPGIIPRLRALVQRVKAHPAYTSAIGVDLGIEPGTVLLPQKPMGVAEPLPGSVVALRFTKSGHGAMLVESRRNGETAWLPLGTFMRSPARDTRAPLAAQMPEMRDYRFRFVDGDEPVGEYSDLVRITTQP
jgi:hypothetical protein